MKIKIPNIEFVSFNDGICDIYSEDEEENKQYKYKNLGFSNYVLGFKRHFAASAVQIKVDRVVKIPKVNNIDTHDILEIKDIGRYNIELAQLIYDTNPPSINLTLSNLEMFEVK